MSAWLQVCKLEDVPRRGARVVQHGGQGIALFRSGDDEVFALHDKCPHKGGPLSQGIVHGKQVTCPLHSWKIQLDSGEAVAPDKGCAHVCAVKVEGGKVYLQI